MRFSFIAYGVQSDDMFRVLHINPTTIRYEEKDRSLTIRIEKHLDRSMDVYLRQAVRWNSPHEKDRLDATRRQMVRFRIESALIFEGYSPQFDGSSLFAPEGSWSITGLDPNLAIG